MGSYKAQALILMSVVVFTQMIGESRGTARYINYGPLERDEVPGCGPIHPENCQHEQRNPYTRGCLPFERCREPISGRADMDFDKKIVADDDDVVQQPILKASGPAAGG